MMNISRPPPAPVDEFIGFRVECQSVTSGSVTKHRFNGEGGICPDVFPATKNFWRKADDHMSWRPVNSPFVSFFRTWERAMRWRRNLIRERGGTGIRIIAVCLRGLTRVYDAHEIARSLGYPSTGPGVRPMLENHEDELLVEGGIDSGYRVLAIFNGDTLDEEDVSLSPLADSPERVYGARIPKGSLPRTTATESLRDEMYNLIGTRDDFKLYLLVLKMCGATLECPPGPGRITGVEEKLHVSNSWAGMEISCGRVGFVYAV